MKENKVQFIAVTAMAVALTYVFTAFVNVRLPIAANGGLIHLGNVPLFIMAILFVIKIVGYYIAEIILYGNFVAPITSVPGNVVQIAVAAVIVLIVIEPIEIAVKKIGITQFA